MFCFKLFHVEHCFYCVNYYLPSNTSNTEISLGETPGMRPA